MCLLPILPANKKAPAQAVSRNIEFLGWLNREKPEARVSMHATDLGCWKDLRPFWKVRREKILLCLETAQGPRRLWITAVRITPQGADLIILRKPSSLPDAIHIRWQEDDSTVDAGRRSLSEIAGSWMRQYASGSRIIRAAQCSDRTHSISSAFLRVWLSSQRGFSLLLVSDDNAAHIHALMTQTLLWLVSLLREKKVKTAPAVYLLVPEDFSAVPCHRSGFLSEAKICPEIWEYSATGGPEYAFRKAVPPSAPLENRDFRWPILGPFRWSTVLANIIDLAPELIRRHPRFDDYDSLRLRGLEFARVMGPDRDRVCFGIGPGQVELTEDNFDRLRVLVEEILYFRRPDSPSSHHPYYRLQAERWLECLMLDRVGDLFPEVNPAAVYPQIPVYLTGEPGRVDILGVDREGTLVIMELKVKEDPDLPLQAVDYWGRVILHNERGDFERRGYFAGIPLSRRPPKVYLVSPVFAFHDSTERLLGFLKSDLEVWKVAINEDWRCGVKVLHRTRLRCGDL